MRLSSGECKRTGERTLPGRLLAAAARQRPERQPLQLSPLPERKEPSKSIPLRFWSVRLPRTGLAGPAPITETPKWISSISIKVRENESAQEILAHDQSESHKQPNVRDGADDSGLRPLPKAQTRDSEKAKLKLNLGPIAVFT